MIFEDDNNPGVMRTGSPRDAADTAAPALEQPSAAVDTNEQDTAAERQEAGARRGSSSLASARWRAAGFVAMALVYMFATAATGWVLAAQLPEMLTAKQMPGLVRGVLLTYILLFLMTGVAFSLWMGKAARILRRFGNVTPLKSGVPIMLWFFVPVFASWRPYQLVRALWQGSRNPADWDNVPVGQTLRIWWTAWTAHKLFFIGGVCVEWIMIGERKLFVEKIAIWGFAASGILAALCLTIIVLQITRSLGQRLG